MDERKNKKTFRRASPGLFVLIFALSPMIFAYADETADADDSSSAVSVEEIDSVSSDEAQEEDDRRKQVLRYGIDTEVLEVLSNIRSEDTDRYNGILAEVLIESRNADIASAIYRQWSDTDWDGGFDYARSEIGKVIEDEDYEIDVVRSAVAYLAELEDSESLPLLSELAEHRNTGIAASAVRAVGNIGESDDAEGLTDDIGAVLLERLMDEDPVAEEDLVSAVIVALGQIRYETAAGELTLIAEDEGSSAGHRRLACVSVGRIGRSDDYEIIERLYYESDDAMLRSYALAGLAEFPGRDTTGVLVQALKRDSFWRIRVTAAEKLGDVPMDGDLAELLRYKAANDPVNHVRIASMKSLGPQADRETKDFLRDFFLDDDNSAEMRLTALDVLVENRIGGTDDAVLEVMEKLWEKDSSRFLEYTCRNLSRSDWDGMSRAYERMLDHDNWLIQVYGIRGIRRNGLSGLEGRVKALDTDGVDGRVRREAATD